jgi:DNA-binding NarL/FixJ family response regulator
MSRIRLMIVDENESVRRALEARLRNMPDLEVLGSVGDASQALQMVEELSPEIILLEPKRLDGEGIRLCREFSASPGTPSVIVLTSYHDEEEALIAETLGAMHYMLKDIDTKGLLAAIRDAYQRRARRLRESAQ